MKPWLSRNTMPIVLVLVASALVVGAFEAIDAFAGESPQLVNEASGAEPAGVASVGGLIKVAAFLGIGALIAKPIRSRFSGQASVQE